MSAPSRHWISIERSGVSMCLRAVEVRLERARPPRVTLRILDEAHDLEAAGVGEDRPVPAHEAMQAAEPRDALGAGRSIR